MLLSLSIIVPGLGRLRGYESRSGSLCDIGM